MTDATSTLHRDRSFPRLHPRPAEGWVNDPNGILFAEGRWHLFFQYNPASARHEHICWGHVSSPDLLSWEEHPVALRPLPDGPDSYGCWSGVGTVDGGVPSVVYSGAADDSGFSEVVVVRGSSDALDWSGERVVAAGLPQDPLVTMVRDPFLFELGGRRWAVQGAGRSDVGGALLLYSVDDLGAWVEHGFLLTTEDAVASELPACAGWECPQLVRIGDGWVLMLSLWSPDEPHRGVGYVLGSLEIDGETGLPAFITRRTGFVDDGSTFYAPQAVQAGGADGGPERVLIWGWAQEGTDAGTGRTQDENDAAGWSGLLTFPREVVVRDGAVELVPARELEALRAGSADIAALPDQAEVVVRGTGTVELRLDGGVGRVLWSADLDDDEVRVLIDASIVEIHRVGHPSRTLRAHPGDEESYAVRLGDGLTAEAWALRLPERPVR